MDADKWNDYSSEEKRDTIFIGGDHLGVREIEIDYGFVDGSSLSKSMSEQVIRLVLSQTFRIKL